MTKYRKKPIIIEAFKVGDDLPEWAVAAVERGTMHYDQGAHRAEVVTYEGPKVGKDGYWIIQGVEGELYPCKGSVFEATYEPVEDNS